MIEKLTRKQIEDLKKSGQILSTALQIVSKSIKPGMPTMALDEIAETELRIRGGKPSFKNYSKGKDKPYPSSLCVSINNEVVHGIPVGAKVIQSGDLVGLDLGCSYNGIYTDMAVTVGVGKISAREQQLIEVTKKALQIGITKVRAGKRTGDIGHAIQKYVESHGFSVVKDLVGHGVGLAVHQDPTVPNFGKANTGEVLIENTAIAIEPMVNVGRPEIIQSTDGWTVVTRDGSKAAHFEHTILITKKEPIIITKTRT